MQARKTGYKHHNHAFDKASESTECFRHEEVDTIIEVHQWNQEQQAMIEHGQFKCGEVVCICIICGTPRFQESHWRSDDIWKRHTYHGFIKAMIEYKKQYNSEYPRLIWQFVVFGHNEHEIEQARAMAQERGMVFNPVPNLDPTYSPIKDPEALKQSAGDGVDRPS